MLGAVVVFQSIVIIWLLVLLGTGFGGLRKRIDRASRHLEVSDKSEDPKPICGCTHHHCFHNEKGCWYEPTTYDVLPSSLIQIIRGEKGERIKDTFDLPSCGCRSYTGPEPLPMVLP